MSTVKKQDTVLKDKEAGEEAQYARQKVKQDSFLASLLPVASQHVTTTRLCLPREQEQLASLRAQSGDAASQKAQPSASIPREDRDYEAGFGGQEDLEDRYATTSGEH